MPTPTVLFPGIMGSRLYFVQAKKFWDPDDNWRMAPWLPIWPLRSDDDNRIELHAQRQAYVVVDNAGGLSDAQMNRGWSGVIWSYYGDLLQRLQANSTAYAVGYDWRQDILWLGGYAADKIDRILADTGAERVRVVTHSMGGLVVRAALAVRPDLQAKIAAVIHVCQPSAGAVIMYRRLFTGLYSPYDGGASIGDRAFRLLLGNSRKGFLGNVSGLPGAMQLLPSRYFPKDGGGDLWNPWLEHLPHEALYLDPASPPGIVPDFLGLTAEVVSDLKDRVADVARCHQTLGDPAVPHHPECWLVYGHGQPTEVAISFSAGGASPGVDNVAGDNTVPEISAMSLHLQPARTIAAADIKHPSACGDGFVQNQVLAILANYP